MKYVQESLNSYNDDKFFNSLLEEEERMSPEEKKKMAIQLEKEGKAIIKKINDNFKRFKTIAGDKLQSYKDFWAEQKATHKTIGQKGTFYNLYDSHYIVGIVEDKEGMAKLVVWNTDSKEKNDWETFVCRDKGIIKEFINFYNSELEGTMKQVIANHNAAVEAKKAAEAAQKKAEAAAAKKAKLDKFLAESKKK